MKMSVPLKEGFYVYLHRVRDVVVYVGKGRFYRAFVFGLGRNEEWLKATAGAESIEVEIVHWCLSEQEAFAMERQKIIEFQPIANLTFTEATKTRRLTLARKGYDEAAEKQKVAAFRALLGRRLKKRNRRRLPL